METRLLIAYTLMATIAVVAVIGGVAWRRKRIARKRRLRGIKTAGNH